ncbi:MAG: cytochrome C [Acidobacteria bacterium]|nr:MAG: cytochrome C [Acidobacteriota bacterium]
MVFIKRFFRLVVMSLGVTVMALVGNSRTLAITSFARQTGLPCSSCHTIPPELTPFGRTFKLNGYTLTGLPQITAKPARQEAGLSLSRYMPIAAFIQFSNAGTKRPQPGTENWNFEFPQSASLFLAGAMSDHVGSFIQVTYDAQADHFSWDNTDVRYANRRTFAGKDLVYGVTFNNNPTVEDLWNDTPTWGFPWVTPNQTPTPMAGTLIEGGLAQDVAGLGGYAMWNDHLYGAATIYRSEHIGSPQPNTGTGFGINIRGAAPYWRLAWQQTMGNNYLEVGTYGMHVASSPGAITGPEDFFTDVAADAQYERILPSLNNNTISIHTTYVHESTNLEATYGLGSASFPHHDLSTFKLDGTYHFQNKYGATAGYFTTWGTTDPVLYAPNAVVPLAGSANGDPKSNGYILQFAYWPWQNIDFTAQYTGYLTFNGGSTNYDGAGRNASDNNAAYFTAWFIF